MTDLAPTPPRGLRFALLAPPSVQALRFGTKALLAWFLLPEEYGQATLAGLLAYLASHLALLGLNEALVQAPRVTAETVRRLRRIHHASGLALSLAMAAIGVLLGRATEDPLLLAVVVATAPMVWLANLATLPTALLVRAQEYRRLFTLDVVAALALAVVTIGCAAAGLGPWSIIAGLYANALASVGAAVLHARHLVPDAERAEAEDVPELLRRGRHFCAAEMTSYGSEQVDGLGVGLVIGRAALGLYGYALTLGQVAMQFTVSFAERSLFPILTERERAGRLAESFAEALRVVFVFLLPWHLLLATAAAPLTRLLFPESWAGVAPLLALLALASGARCVDVVAATALKAAGSSATVARLGLVRLGVHAVLVLAALPFGVVWVAAAVLASRTATAGLVLVAARERIGRPASSGLSSGGRALVAWCAAYLALALALWAWSPAGPLRLALLVAGALLAWTLARVVWDRERLRGEWRILLAAALERDSRVPPAVGP